jgi:hypothetical protein
MGGWNVWYKARLMRRWNAKSSRERYFRVTYLYTEEAAAPFRVVCTKGVWRMSTTEGRGKLITHAATLAMLEGIGRNADALAKNYPRADDERMIPRIKDGVPYWDGLRSEEVRKVLSLVEVPPGLLDSLREEFPELL